MGRRQPCKEQKEGCTRQRCKVPEVKKSIVFSREEREEFQCGWRRGRAGGSEQEEIRLDRARIKMLK